MDLALEKSSYDSSNRKAWIMIFGLGQRLRELQNPNRFHGKLATISGTMAEGILMSALGRAFIDIWRSGWR